MPTSYDLATTSVNCWFYPSVDDQSAEVAPADAGYVVFETFTGLGMSGESLGLGSTDTGHVPAMTVFEAVTVPELLTNAELPDASTTPL